MKVLYYNLQLGACDGSNTHAQGMLESLKNILGDDNVLVPMALSKQNSGYSHTNAKIKEYLKKILIPFRIIRRKKISKDQTKKIVNYLHDRNFNPDIILARSVLYDETPIMLKNILKCRLVIEHNTPLVYEVCDIKKMDKKKNVKQFEEKILNEADGIYCVSNVLKQMLVKSYGNNILAKTISIPNGYIAKLYSDINEEELKKEYNPKNKKIIAFIGSLQKWHGIDNLLSAANDLENRNDLEFWIIGDGIERDLIKKYIFSHSNVRWFGNVPTEKMAKLLSVCDLGVMPYKHMENFYFSPLKMFDMIGAKLPFIGTSIGQIEEIVNNELNEYFLIEDSDGSSLAKKIIELSDDENKYIKMKKDLTLRAHNHTWDCRAQILVSWMEEILAKN